MHQKKVFSQIRSSLIALFVITSLLYQAAAITVAHASSAHSGLLDDSTNPPTSPVKLIFIHHSTGQNWLDDGNGGLGLALSQNNYFVSDTNYGWGPNSIGDSTDIPNWLEWFRSSNTPTYMSAVYAESGQHSSYTRTLADPGGENQIIMFKSCFPNSALSGSPTDPPSADGWLTVGHAKYVYNQLLLYFKEHPEKLFVVITAPPLSDNMHAANARAFNQWLVNDWLTGYTLNNVAVFDFYNVLTSNGGSANTNDLNATTGNHHRWINGAVQHKTDGGSDTLAYPSGDDHPSQAGNQKATAEFLPMLNIFYNRWKSNDSTIIISGNAGVAGATLTYTDGVVKTATANTTGAYSFSVSANWSGQVTPSKPGVPSFTPASINYTNVTTSQVAQNYKPNKLAAFVSVASQDGYILESTETSGVGGVINSSATFFAVGDNALKRQFRGILSFNTASLPDNAVIVSAELKLRRQKIMGANPFITHDTLVIDIRRAYFGAAATLGRGDFASAASVDEAGVIANTPAGAIYTGSFSTEAFPAFNRTGLTQLRLRFQLDDDDDRVADYLAFYSSNVATKAFRPALQILYYVP